MIVSGNIIVEGDFYMRDGIPAGVATILPGMLVEYYLDGGVLKVRPHSNAANYHTLLVALSVPERNWGIDRAYAIGENVPVAGLRALTRWQALVPTAITVVTGAPLQSNGDGLLKLATAVTAAAGLARYIACEGVGLTSGTTRVEAMCIG